MSSAEFNFDSKLVNDSDKFIYEYEERDWANSTLLNDTAH